MAGGTSQLSSCLVLGTLLSPHDAWSVTWASAHLVFDLVFLLPGHPSKLLSVPSAQHAQLSPGLFGTAGTVSE